MKISDILLEKQDKKGTYVGAKFTSDTVARLKKFAKDNDIPNALDSKKYHTTLIYSRKYIPGLEVENKLKHKWIGTPKKLEVFKTNQGWKALVLVYDCPEQKDKHEEIMETTDATYDYPEYKVHVTLSYNIGDYPEDKLDKLDVSKIGDIIVDKLYVEDLDLDWASSTIKKD